MKESRTVQNWSLRSSVSAMAAAILLLPVRVAVAAVDTGLNETANEAKLDTTNADIPLLIGSIIRSLLGFVGVLFLVLTVYAGFLWMTSQGNEEQVSKAKNILKGATIGAILTFASYSIVNFVLRSIVQ